MELDSLHHVDSVGRSTTTTNIVLSKTPNTGPCTRGGYKKHRQRSLREIIGGASPSTCEIVTRKQKQQQQQSRTHCTRATSFMNVLLDDLGSDLLPRRSTQALSRKLPQEVLGSPNVFQKLKPTHTAELSIQEKDSSDEKEKIQNWLQQFKQYIIQGTPSIEEAERRIHLLFQFHPELWDHQIQTQTQIQEQEQSQNPEQNNVATTDQSLVLTTKDFLDSCNRKRVQVKKNVTEGGKDLATPNRMTLDEKSDREKFFCLIGEWLKRVRLYIETQPFVRHPVLWEKARLCFVYKTLASVLDQLETFSYEYEGLNRETPERFTSGVSFVRKSESIQQDVSHIYTPLPHAIIQPPNLQLVKTNFVSEVIEIIKRAPVLTVRMPNKDDSAVKRYLLEKECRRDMVTSSPGSTCYTIQGLESISQMISDRAFLCCHYHLDENGVFEPSIPDQHNHQKGIQQSNIQVVIIVRKGIGGTCTLKNSARSLNDLQILPLLMGTKSFSDLTFTEDVVSSSCSTTPLVRKRTLAAAEREHNSGMKAIPVCKSVPVRSSHESVDNNLPPPVVVKGSLSDWFSSVKSTASQILASIPEPVTPHRKVPEVSWLNGEGAQQQAEFDPSHSKSSKRRRSTRCTSQSNALMRNVKLHTLSCRLEMFVEEVLWQSLSNTKRNELNSIVLGLEEWILEKIQNWNKDRMFRYCTEVIAVVEGNMEDLDRETPRFRNKHILRTQAEQRESPLKEEENHELCSNNIMEKEKEDEAEIFGEPPEVPNFCNTFSANAVKTTAVASGIHRPGLPEVPWPFYLITTRDCFTYDLIQVKRKVSSDGRTFIKTDFYFHPETIPEDFPLGSALSDGTYFQKEGHVLTDQWEEVAGFPSEPPLRAIPAGVTTYSSLFSSKELDEIERMADKVHEDAQLGIYPPECFHPTIGRSGGLKRTKYFFGARYLWTREQMADSNSHVACGVRVDVPPNPAWMKDLVEDPLVQGKIIPKKFINSWALNMYHDGSEGIQSHYDDSSRFCQPIYSLRLFSDSRLSFGTQLYGFTNGAFFVPMPRGCITIMHDKSYAANFVKHCVRPCDMTGKSAGLIMRKINDRAWKEAVDYHLNETIDWMSRMHLDEEYVSNPEKCITSSPKKNKSVKSPPHASSTESSVKNETQSSTDVRNVMENLLKSVTKNLNQEALNGNKLKKMESKAVRQVIDQMIRVLESMERQQIRDQKQRVQETTQVRAVIENMMKKIEKNVYSPRKRKDQNFPCISQKNKRSKSIMESKPMLSNESVLAAASQIIERVMGPANTHVMQSACTLLKKFGCSWLKLARADDEDLLSAADEFRCMPEEEGCSDLMHQKKSVSTHTSNRNSARENSELCSLSESNAELSTKLGLTSSANYENYSISRPMTRSLLNDLTQAEDPRQQFSDKDAKFKTETGEEESKKLLSSLVATVLQKAVKMETKEENDGENSHLPEDLLKQVAQETDMLDLGLLSESSSLLVKTESSKRTYKLVPWGICFHCEKDGFDSVSDQILDDSLWQCQGPCRRSFHYSCRPHSQSEPKKCEECMRGTHKCHICGQEASATLGSVAKCSLGICGRYYHVPCVMSVPATTVLHGNWMPVGSVSGDKTCMKFRCPQHYCQTCGLSGANVFSVTCIRCPAAFHARCRPAGCIQLSKKLILCPKHQTKQ